MTKEDRYLTMKLKLLVLFSLICGCALGQELKGVVTDAATGEPLPYANVSIDGKNIGCITSGEGKFILSLTGADNKDTIVVGYLGYASVSMPVGSLDLSLEQAIALEPAIYSLETVHVSAGNRETETLGNSKAWRKMTGWGDFRSSRGRMRGLVIGNAACPARVKSFSFRINHNDWDSVAFRLNFLEMENAKPGNSILTENIIFHTDKKFKWVTVDLEKYGIEICDKVLATLEWVDAWGTFGEYSNMLTLSLSKNGGYVYSREADEATGAFRFDENAPAMFIEVYK